MLTLFNEGENAIKNAPLVKLRNGVSCIPQHYLSYSHTLESVQKVVLECEYSERFPIFAGEDNGGVYIQIGVIGYDNYRQLDSQEQKKIVYGRKWRVEPDLPTSELIQTIYLGIKKAKEHEVRELFRISVGSRWATPFNGHHDLPLMAKHADLFNTSHSVIPVDEYLLALRELAHKIQYDHASVHVIGVEQRTKTQILIDCKVEKSEHSQLPENISYNFTLILGNLSLNEFLHELITYFLHKSDREVDENFSFRNFNRFSRNIDIRGVADLSLQTRDKTNISNQEFLSALEKTNYQTDIKRAPVLSANDLANKVQRNLAKFGKLDGVMPNFNFYQVSEENVVRDVLNE